MNHSQTATLLAMIAAYDRRTIGDADVAAWQATLHDVDAADARLAVIAHYRATRDWLMPADVVEGVRDIRSDRLARVGPPVRPPSTLDAAEYSEATRVLTRAAQDGRMDRDQHAQVEAGVLHWRTFEVAPAALTGGSR